jgi:hypothetical protein
MTDLKYPQWQHSYQEALLELDQRKLNARIGVAEIAISLRFREMPSTPDQNEVQALRDALSGLRGLKDEALRFNASQDGAAHSNGIPFLVN